MYIIPLFKLFTACSHHTACISLTKHILLFQKQVILLSLFSWAGRVYSNSVPWITRWYTCHGGSLSTSGITLQLIELLTDNTKPRATVAVIEEILPECAFETVYLWFFILLSGSPSSVHSWITAEGWDSFDLLQDFRLFQNKFL